MCGWQVKLCDPIVTHGPYLSALEMHHDKDVDVDEMCERRRVASLPASSILQ